MHTEIVRKMNEIIGFLKLVERELDFHGSIEEKKLIASRRASEFQVKTQDLNILIAKHGRDEMVEKYHRDLMSDIDRVLNVREPVNDSF